MSLIKTLNCLAMIHVSWKFGGLLSQDRSFW